MKLPFDLSNFDLSSVMEMARGLKQQVAQMEEGLGRIEVESVVGGGMVTVRATAAGTIISIALDPELLAMNDKVMVEGLLVSGVNQALQDAKRRREEEMQKLTGGLGLPGWLA
ncbi:MAG TPA: YbaB/EbfC family nucleoid-associated protein [bacterium]|nr:YbaB/EbfC family nucleoid-associated protein [bacterium]